MKKFVIIFSILIAGSCLCACSSDDDDFNPNAITQINLPDGEIVDFFNSELRELHGYDYYRTSTSFFYKIIDSINYDGMAIQEDIVYVINSRQELADIYLGGKELPTIDFDKYTLIIGQQIMPYRGFYIAKKELLAGDNGLILNLYTKNDHELIPCASQNLYFWGLYPKQSLKTITVNTFKEYTYFPDMH